MSALHYHKLLKFVSKTGQHKVLKDLMSMQLFATTGVNIIEAYYSAGANIREEAEGKKLVLDNGPIDLPFPCMMFENLDGNISGEIMVGVVERGPDDYTFFTVDETFNNELPYDIKWYNAGVHNTNDQIAEYNTLKELLRELCNQIHKKHVYEHDPKIPLMVEKTIKDKSNSKKRKKIRRKALPTSTVIYIGVKNQFKQYAKKIGHVVTPCRWHFRRGTWRQLSKKCPISGKFDVTLGPDSTRIGFNREGEKIVKGYTWIDKQEINPLNNPKGNGPVKQTRIY